MIQKKICMVGVFATGKTCLVQRYVHSIFSPRYLSTVGVKIDRKEVSVHGEPLMLLLWDLEGRDGTRDVNPSYVRGAHGLIFVVDGTRPETLAHGLELHELVAKHVGLLPSVFAFNKSDLSDDWKLSRADEDRVTALGLYAVHTSAKTGLGVETTFQWLADATHPVRGAQR
jgi:small GTP-binding protein